MGVEYLQVGTVQNLSGQPVPVRGHPHSKKYFLMFSWNFMWFHLFLVLLVGIPDNRPAPSFAQPYTYMYSIYLYIYFGQPYTTVILRFRSISYHFERSLLPVY